MSWVSSSWFKTLETEQLRNIISLPVSVHLGCPWKIGNKQIFLTSTTYTYDFICMGKNTDGKYDCVGCQLSFKICLNWGCAHLQDTAWRETEPLLMITGRDFRTLYQVKLGIQNSIVWLFQVFVNVYFDLLFRQIICPVKINPPCGK